MESRPYGDRAIYVETNDVAQVPSLYATVKNLDLTEIVDVIAGERSLVVVCTEPVRVAGVIRGLAESTLVPEIGPVVDVPVVYDGADLESVAELAGLSVERTIELHRSGEYIAAFGGFVPGFAYLRGLADKLELARLPTPRPRVPAGSVAIAAGYTAVYPRETPGGWRLLGRTDLVMFDPDKNPPALITPGTRVRFVGV